MADKDETGYGEVKKGSLSIVGVKKSDEKIKN